MNLPGVFWSGLLLAIAGFLATQTEVPYALAIALVIEGIAKAVEIWFNKRQQAQQMGQLQAGGPSPLRTWLLG